MVLIKEVVMTLLYVASVFLSFGLVGIVMTDAGVAGWDYLIVVLAMVLLSWVSYFRGVTRRNE